MSKFIVKALLFIAVFNHIELSPMLQETKTTNLDGIYEYSDKYKKELLRIAQDNKYQLVSYLILGVNFKEAEKVCEEQIEASLNEKAKIYLKNDKIIGFVSYGIHTPWYTDIISPRFSKNVNPTAKIYSIAVDKHYKGKGYGTELLKSVLLDCENQLVNKVTLETTGPDEKLDNFYSKFGFKMTLETWRMREREYTLRLKPYLLTGMAKHFMQLMFKIKK